MMDPDWRILSKMRGASGAGATSTPASHTLTHDSLAKLCNDPQLNFVVAKENLGFDAIHHASRGNWKDWYLYDCRRVHASNPPA